MLKKRFLICLALLVALLVANLAMIQAATSSDLTFTLNSAGDGYIVSECKSTASGTLSIPATYSGKPVVEIGREAFLGRTGLTSVTIPSSVKTIGWYAFSGCTGLTSVTIPDSVTTLDWFAFANCTGLTNVTVGNCVTCIDASAFAGCTKLTTVSLGNGVTSIGWSAFKGCTKLSSINIPHGVTSIDRYAFYNCSSLSSVTFCGSQDQWAAVTKGDGNDVLNGVTVTYHEYTNFKENEKTATCKVAGSYESVVYCSSCKAEISRTKVTTGTVGHKMEQTSAAVAPTCVTPGKTAVLTCTYGCGTTEGGIEIPATGHNYVDGTCANGCGTTQIPTDANLKFYSQNAELAVGEDIKGYFYLNSAKFPTYDSFYVKYQIGNDDPQIVDVSYTSGTWFFFYYPVFAFRMTESIEATLYGVKGGVAYEGQSVTWNMRDTIVAKLDAFYKGYGSNPVQTAGCYLLADMLKFGTESQITLNAEDKNYPTNNLDPKYVELIKQGIPEMRDMIAIDETGKQATVYQMGLMLQERVKLAAIFKITNARNTSNNDYKVVIEFVESKERFEIGSESLEFQGTNTKYITLQFDKIKPQLMRDTMNIAVYLKDQQISATIVRSGDMLVKSLLEKHPTLVPAIMNYSDTVVTYFDVVASSQS